MSKKHISIGAIAALPICMSSHAAVVANFTDHTDVGVFYGTGNNTGQTTAVDQFSGIAGNGWTGGWTTSTNGSILREKEVRNNTTDPGTELNNQGNYLNLNASAAAGTGIRQWAFQRGYTDFGDLDTSDQHTVSFLLRMDEASGFGNGGSGMFISDGGERGANITNMSWGIRLGNSTTTPFVFGYDGVGDGAGFSGSKQSVLKDVDTNANYSLNLGVTYLFTIDVDPLNDSFDVTVSNISSGATGTVTDLGFNNTSGSVVGEFSIDHRIVADTEGGNNRILNTSLDSLSISEVSVIPEPGSLGLAIIGATSIAMRRRQLK